MKVARIYLRVSSAKQDLTRQAGIEHSTRVDGYYVAGVYREKAFRNLNAYVSFSLNVGPVLLLLSFNVGPD